MYIVSNAPPAIDPVTHCMNVYGGLAVAVIDSIPPEGAVWAGITTKKNDTTPIIDHDHNIERLPILVDDANDYFKHYAPWSKKVVYASFHGLTEYAGLEGERFASPAEETEDNYRAHVTTVKDFGAKLAAEILHRDGMDGIKKPVIVHDYQLDLAAAAMRDNGLQDYTIGMFLHIPFPTPETFWMIPHAREIVHAYLAYDLISFQDSERSLKNFVEVVKQAFPNTTFDNNTGKLVVDGRERLVKAFAASIDPDVALEEALKAENNEEVMGIVREAAGRKIVFSAQRFDIIKGLPQALTAIEEMLDETPGLSDEAFFAFCCQPTKYDGVACYDEYQAECLGIIDRIQNKHPGALKHIHGLKRESALGLMRHADVMYISTLIEGQNLVVKEFASANEGNSKPRTIVLTEGCAAYFGLKHTDGVFIKDGYSVAQQKAGLYEALARPPEKALAVIAEQQKAIRDWTSRDYGRELTAALIEAGKTPHMNGFDRSLSGIPVAKDFSVAGSASRPTPPQDAPQTVRTSSRAAGFDERRHDGI